MSTQSWKEQFGAKVSGYNPVESNGLSELAYALKHKQIAEKDYLDWARKTYQICSVDVKFFQSVKPPRSLYDRLKDVYAWGPELMPVGEWDDHVIIVGLEKPSDLPKEIKPIFLFAPFEGLSLYWDVYSSEEPIAAENSEETAEAGGLLEGISLEAAPVTSISFAGIGVRHEEKDLEEKTAHGVPLTVSQQMAKDKVQQAAKSSLQQNAKTAPAQPEVKAKPIVQEKSNLGDTLPEIKPPPLTEIRTVATTPLQPKKAPPSSAISIDSSAPKISPLKATGTPVSDDTKTALTKTGITKTAPVSMNTPVEKKAEPIILSDEAIELKAEPQVMAVGSSDVKVDEALVRQAMNEYQKHYEKRAYLEYDLKNKKVHIKYYPDELVIPEDVSAPLDQDSFLSVVAKTQKPYHGYVVKNIITDKFFKSLNSGEIPENVTVVPIVRNDEVIGALMGWGPKNTYTMTVLRDMEKTMTNLCIKLGFSSTEAA